MVERSVYKIVGGEEDVRGIAKRVAKITVSAIKQMPVLASKVEDCISLGQGIPSLATPSFIREAVIEELRQNDGIGKYSLQPGLPALKEAIARRFQQTKGIAVDPEREIFISCGAMEAIAGGIATIIERGDEVLIPTPNYSSHIEQVLFAEGVPVFVPLIEEEGWKLNIEGFRKAVTKKTKAIVVCNPMNPTGAVFAEKELRALAEIALERELFLVADEAYDFLVYDDRPHFSLTSIPELRKNLVACYSFSKMYCMTGWRVGYMVASSRIVDQVLKVHDAFAICAPTISQYAALAALRATN
jgi:aminotransferase